ncbi:MAG: glycoside hydrolase family 3 N-terminal domain-containing protein [Pseudomonadota bacterium]
MPSVGSLRSAVILSCAGTRLTPREAILFARLKPAGVFLFKRNCRTPEQLARLVREIRQVAGPGPAGPGPTGDDILIGIDQEGGRVARMRPPAWRSLPAPGWLRDVPRRHRERAARAHARRTVAMLRPAGINANATPLLDLAIPGADAIIGDRALGDTVRDVVDLARIIHEEHLAGGVLPIIKHLPGHGRVMGDPHDRAIRITADHRTLVREDFAPFRAFADAPAGLVGHPIYPVIDPHKPASLSSAVIERWIRQEIGFTGLLISDDLAMGALRGPMARRVQASLAAGCDLALYCRGRLVVMENIGQAAPVLTGAALDRFNRAMALLR